MLRFLFDIFLMTISFEILNSDDKNFQSFKSQLKMQEKYNLTWHTYSDHLRVMMKEMMTSGDFADVTLVCDDKRQVRAHRNVLAASSPVFKDILKIENSSVIFLKGVEFSEMESILQFIYLGEATFYEERMNHFLEAAKSLEIKELNKEVEEAPDEEDNSIQENENLIIRDSIDEQQTTDIRKQTPVKGTRMAGIQNDKTYCVECDKSYSNYSALYKHKKAFHEGVTYNCNQCDYKSALKANLKRHIETKHEDIKKFACNFCEYRCFLKTDLQRHMKKKHANHLE